MDIEFEGADRVGDLLDGVTLSVGVVVHRINAPLVAGAVVAGVLDPVEDRVTEHHVRRSHVDLGAEHFLPVGIFPCLHLPEYPEVLLDAAVPVRAFGSRPVDGTAAFADFLLGLVVDVGLSVEDHLLCPLVELVEVV